MQAADMIFKSMPAPSKGLADSLCMEMTKAVRAIPNRSRDHDLFRALEQSLCLVELFQCMQFYAQL